MTTIAAFFSRWLGIRCNVVPALTWEYRVNNREARRAAA